MANYGWRLYEHFFKTYSEKVWGVPAFRALGRLGRPAHQGDVAVEGGVGAPARPAGRRATGALQAGHQPDRGVPVPQARPGHDVGDVPGPAREGRGRGAAPEPGDEDRARRPAGPWRWSSTTPGNATRVATDHVVSSMPFSELVRAMDPPPPPEVLAAAGRPALPRLPHRGAGGARRRRVPRQLDLHPLPHGVKVGRIQNFGAWSPFMVRDGTTCLGMEYFVFEGDDLWDRADDELIALATAELASIGLVRGERRREGLRGAHAQGLPRLRRRLPGGGGHHAPLAGRRGAQRPPRGPQRDAQVQQPGPLHVHGHAHGGEHRGRTPATTSGR